MFNRILGFVSSGAYRRGRAEGFLAGFRGIYPGEDRFKGSEFERSEGARPSRERSDNFADDILAPPIFWVPGGEWPRNWTDRYIDGWITGFTEGRNLRGIEEAKSLSGQSQTDKAGTDKGGEGQSSASALFGLLPAWVSIRGAVVGIAFLILLATVLDWITPPHIDVLRALPWDTTPSSSHAEQVESVANLLPQAQLVPGEPVSGIIDVSRAISNEAGGEFRRFSDAWTRLAIRAEASDRANPYDLLDPNRLAPLASELFFGTECDVESQMVSCGVTYSRDKFLRLEWPLRRVTSASGEILRYSGFGDLRRPEFFQGGVFPDARQNNGDVVTTRVCPASRRDGDLECEEDFMVFSFSLVNMGEANARPALFRSIGYDWIRRDELARAEYVVELFAIVSAYKITMKIHEDGLDAFQVDGQPIVSQDVFESWRETTSRLGGPRFGNLSDTQLGLSRGACAIMGGSGAEVDIDPNLYTPGLSRSGRSIGIGQGDQRVSVPCSLFMNWRIQQLDEDVRAEIFSSAGKFLPEIVDGRMRYLGPPGEIPALLQERTLAIRSTAMTLHMLGFEVSLVDRLNGQTNGYRISGQWPREGFLLP